MERTYIKDLKEQTGKEVSISCWVDIRRDQGKLIFFEYSGDLSISSDISNELSFLYPEKLIVVAYSSGPITNISMRGKNVRNLIEKIIKNFDVKEVFFE